MPEPTKKIGDANLAWRVIEEFADGISPYQVATSCNRSSGYAYWDSYFEPAREQDRLCAELIFSGEDLTPEYVQSVMGDRWFHVGSERNDGGLTNKECKELGIAEDDCRALWSVLEERKIIINDGSFDRRERKEIFEPRGVVTPEESKYLLDKGFAQEFVEMFERRDGKNALYERARWLGDFVADPPFLGNPYWHEDLALWELISYGADAAPAVPGVIEHFSSPRGNMFELEVFTNTNTMTAELIPVILQKLHAYMSKENIKTALDAVLPYGPLVMPHLAYLLRFCRETENGSYYSEERHLVKSAVVQILTHNPAELLRVITEEKWDVVGEYDEMEWLKFGLIAAKDDGRLAARKLLATKNPNMSLAVISVLAELGPTADDIIPIAVALDHAKDSTNYGKIKEKLHRSSEKFGADVVPVIKEMIVEGGKWRDAAFTLIDIIQGKASPVMPLLLALLDKDRLPRRWLDSPDSLAVLQLRSAMSKCVTIDNLDDLLTAAENITTVGYRTGIRQENLTIIMDVITSLFGFSKDLVLTQEIEQHLMKVMKKTLEYCRSNEECTLVTLDAFAEHPVQAEELVFVLVNLLDTQGSLVQLATLRALANMGNSGRYALGKLEELIATNRYWNVRDAAQRAKDRILNSVL